ncbi:cytochrome C-552 [Oceanibaculum nanhaiense]|uniref:cytochrome C-552 n=1 Tax=Oceanibaculum nanhaiense TaxID=1909734 RepID=UPI00396EFAED
MLTLLLALLLALPVTAALAQGYNPLARPGFNPLAPGTPSGQSPGKQVEGNPELGGLPDGKGAEETFYACTACHSAAIIKQQHISDARWDDLWTWMIETQGMPEYPPEDKELILGYLKQHFSSER